MVGLSPLAQVARPRKGDTDDLRECDHRVVPRSRSVRPFLNDPKPQGTTSLPSCIPGGCPMSHDQRRGARRQAGGRARSDAVSAAWMSRPSPSAPLTAITARTACGAATSTTARAIGPRCCGSLMEPIAITVRGDGEWILVHRCNGCDVVHLNRTAGDDNPLILLRWRSGRSPSHRSRSNGSASCERDGPSPTLRRRRSA